MAKQDRKQLKISYTLTMDDVMSFLRHQFVHSPKLMRTQLVLRIAIPSVMGLLLFMIFTDNFSRAVGLGDGIIILACVMSGFLFLPLTYRRSLEKATRRLYTDGANRDLLGRHGIVLDGEGIADESKRGKTRYPWSAVASAVRTESHVFFFLSVEAAIIVPLREIQKEAVRESLYGYASSIGR